MTLHAKSSTGTQLLKHALKHGQAALDRATQPVRLMTGLERNLMGYCRRPGPIAAS